MLYSVCNSEKNIRNFSRKINRIFILGIDKPKVRSSVAVHPLVKIQHLEANYVLVKADSVSDIRKCDGKLKRIFLVEDRIIKSMYASLKKKEDYLFTYMGNYILRNSGDFSYSIHFYPSFEIRSHLESPPFKPPAPPKKKSNSSQKKK